MLLALNCILAERPRAGFDRGVLPRLLTRWRGEHGIAHLAGDQPLPGHDGYSHLLLSGSELSASRRNPRDDELCQLIRAFADAGKPVFGICYGHQMIARALAGDHTCVRARVPEFGWKRVEITPNALFEGISDLVAVHSHYDEITGLPAAFEVIGSTDKCAVQAFQVRGAPIWGTQFHPEQSLEHGTRMLEENLRTEPLAAEVWVDDLPDPPRVDDNLRLFQNFFSTRAS